MKRILTIPMIALALPLFAQAPAAKSAAATAPASASPQDTAKPVAVINGEVVTADRLDDMYNNLGTQMRTQYDQNGGKAAFLENYLRKRLVVQEALKAGFDKRPDVKADMDSAKDSVLFDRYIRDVIAPNLVTESELRKYYDEHPGDFATPEKVKMRHIVITASGVGPAAKTRAQALEKIKTVATELHAQRMSVRSADPATVARLQLAQFGDAARKYSEDASAESGGDLGWVTKGQLDKQFEDASWKLPKNVVSAIVETQFGYHLIMVEDRKLAGTEPFSIARSQVREFLLTQHAGEVMTQVNRLTNELKAHSKVSVFPENIR